MKTIKILFFAMIFLAVLNSCTNIYYVGELQTPAKLYSSIDTLYSTETNIVPIAEKILIKKNNKDSYYVSNKDYKGYIFKPSFSYYRKFNSKKDNIYDYSAKKTENHVNSEYNYSSSSSSGGSVSVKGYYRKNGTYVSPHTRSASSRRR